MLTQIQTCKNVRNIYKSPEFQVHPLLEVKEVLMPHGELIKCVSKLRPHGLDPIRKKEKKTKRTCKD